MNRTPAFLPLGELPAELRPLAEGASVLDSSCSSGARVYLRCWPTARGSGIGW